jgi:hypothetical protein
MPTGPDLKAGVRFSDNPKMDKSGLSVAEKREMWIGGKDVKVTGPVITGGQIREAAQAAGIERGVVITDMASLKKISDLIGKGASLWGAADDVARQYAFEVNGSGDNIGFRAY